MVLDKSKGGGRAQQPKGHNRVSRCALGDDFCCQRTRLEVLCDGQQGKRAHNLAGQTAHDEAQRGGVFRRRVMEVVCHLPILSPANNVGNRVAMMEEVVELSLRGRRALVTGSSRGLGEATAKLLAAEGAHVVVHGRDETRAVAVADSIRAAGGSASVALGDLACDEGADLVAQAALADGDVDILINNAGAFRFLSWTQAVPDEWAVTYNVNVISGVRMIQRLVPQMRQRDFGRIITVGGGFGLEPSESQPHYCASLAARHNLAVSLARELRGSAVTSNVVSPGAILTEETRSFMTEIGQARGWGSSWSEIESRAVESMVPNDRNRFGRPEEVAAAIAYLCSPQADYISGATLRVDGGVIRGAF